MSLGSERGSEGERSELMRREIKSEWEKERMS
jgi:hypothetical protein